jgi:DNA-binding protein HU-beta
MTIVGRKELVSEIRVAASLTGAEARGVLDAVLDKISKSLAAGQTVRLVGFGSWTPSVRKAQHGRNPRTGQTIMIREKHRVRFREGKELTLQLNPPGQPARAARRRA